PLVETDTDKISEGDALDINLDKGIVSNITKGLKSKVKPLPKFMQELLEEDGIVNYYKKYNRLPEV
ncbi:MAG TPA: 3-isopropylmalate dehydratase, partial [Candidatus Omnitrophota bacterium]|nr:3-isopropylmalate dehydratase [Candidatus Omnitrophota bacterium]